MKKILLCLFLLVVDIFFGFYIVFFYAFAVLTDWDSVSFWGSFLVVSVVVVYLALVWLQLFFLFIRKKSKKIKQSFSLFGFIIFLLFVAFNVPILLEDYQEDESVYRDVVFKQYERTFKETWATFDREDSDDYTDKDSSQEFYFTLKGEQVLDKEKLQTLVSYLPNTMEQSFEFVVRSENETQRVIFSKEKEVKGCVDETSESNENCSFLFSENTPLLSHQVHRVLFDSVYMYLPNHTFFTLDMGKTHDSLYEFIDTKHSINVTNLFIQKEGEAIDEYDIRLLVEEVGSIEEGKPFFVHLSDHTTKKEVAFIFSYRPEQGVFNEIYYEQCELSFCEHVAVYKPYFGNDSPYRYQYAEALFAKTTTTQPYAVLYKEGNLYRTGKEGEKLNWVFKREEKQIMRRVADNETALNVEDFDELFLEKGSYSVHLERYQNGRYERVSNIETWTK